MSEQRRMPSFDDPPPENRWKATPKTPAPSPHASTTGADTKTNRTPLIVGAVALGLAAIVGITITVASRGSSTPPAGSRQQTQSLDESNSGSASSADDAPPETQSTSATGLSQTYVGTMYGSRGNYDFTMILRGRSDGDVAGRIIQRHDDGTVAGTEIVSGSLSGKDLDLSTDRWLAGGDWDKTDFYYLRFQDPKFRRFGGEFKCIECGTGRLPIRGRAS